MNKKQFEKLTKLKDAVEEAAETLRLELEEMKDELQDRFDSRSENWQAGEKGEEISNLIDQFQQTEDHAQGIIDGLSDIDLNALDGQ